MNVMKAPSIRTTLVTVARMTATILKGLSFIYRLIDYSFSSTLTPVHLRKAKLMFFFTRYPSSSLLKSFFPDIRFNKNNTAQLVKWFSNFRYEIVLIYSYEFVLENSFTCRWKNTQNKLSPKALSTERKSSLPSTPKFISNSISITIEITCSKLAKYRLKF